MRWGILPAMLCGFVAYAMDSFIPDDESKLLMVWRAVARFSVWALVGMIVTLYATDDLRAIDPELRFTVVVTTMFVVGALAAVSRFKTVQSYIENQTFPVIDGSLSDEAGETSVAAFPGEQRNK